MRIVSLLSSATEIACALGLEDQLVGISHECDYPQSIRSLPVLTKPRLDPSKSGREIDRNVRDALKSGLSLYEIDESRLAELEPDLILTQDQCEVCAVSLKDVEKSLGALTGKNTKICSLKPYSLNDVMNDVQKIGHFSGVFKKAGELIDQMQAFWDDLSQINYEKKPKVLALEWLQPPMVAGGWIPEIITIAGGEPTVVSSPTRFKELPWSDLAEVDAEYVFIFPCGYKIEKTLEETKDDEVGSGLKSLPAYPQGKIFVCDGNSYFNRPGPRLMDSAILLGHLMHPDKIALPAALESAYESLTR